MYKVLDKLTTKRLHAWKLLRDHLERSSTPLDDVADFFNKFPKVKIYTDPYNKLTWPTPWELIEENEYCPFNILLAIAYTLQLCNRFNSIQPKITITIDNNSKTVYYLLYLDDKVYGYLHNEWVDKNQISPSLQNIKIYLLDPLN